ncbi:MAG: hypothetical protein M3N98_10710 [Actinomycetota bacterium]|nr:hypothetical protein [Actinomycetota bacterium]
MTDLVATAASASASASADRVSTIRAMRESRPAVADAASGGRPRTPGATISLDFHAGACTIQAVQPEEQGQDRVTVRLGYVGRSVVTGSAADLQIAARNKSLWRMAWGAGGLSTAGATPGGLAQSEQRGWYDLEFVRPVGLTTTLGGGGRRCHVCGAPYHSDLDTARPNCRQIRVTPEGEWLLARSWLVVA